MRDGNWAVGKDKLKVLMSANQMAVKLACQKVHT